jgi:glycosyltransferase involved in cell wall biosynthesis
MTEPEVYSKPAQEGSDLELFETIRVVHIITKLEFGGAQMNTLYTVEHLDREHFKVALIAGVGGYMAPRAKALQDTRCYFIPEMRRSISVLRDWRAFLKIRRILKKLRPHIVHTHSSKAGILGRWAAYAAGVPIIIHTIHGFAFSEYLPAWRNMLYVFLERITARVTTQFISVSRANIDEGKSRGILGEHDAVNIRSGVDIRRFANAKVDREEKLAELGIQNGAKVVAMVSCLKPQKAPLDFVRVARYVHRQMPDVRFLFVGDGEMRPMFEERVRESGLEDVVKLTGWREDVPEIMKSVDVLLLTSLWEGLPQVYPQAMAAGVPIVGTDIAGADEVVHDNVTGILVPPRRIPKMGDAVVLLLQDDAMRRSMGEAGRRYLRGFDRETMVEDQEALYYQLVLRHLPGKFQPKP